MDCWPTHITALFPNHAMYVREVGGGRRVDGIWQAVVRRVKRAAEPGADISPVHGVRLQVVPVGGWEDGRLGALDLGAALAPAVLGVELEEGADRVQPGPRLVRVNRQLEVSRDREV